jgi:hypothetical protein
MSPCGLVNCKSSHFSVWSNKLKLELLRLIPALAIRAIAGGTGAFPIKKDVSGLDTPFGCCVWLNKGYLFVMAACAAARRAIGTRNGEQLT